MSDDRCVYAAYQVWQCITCRLYREWKELQETLLGDTRRQPSREEAAVLRQKGTAALDALLQIVTEHVLGFIAPGSQPAQARGSSLIRTICLLDITKSFSFKTGRAPVRNHVNI